MIKEIHEILKKIESIRNALAHELVVYIIVFKYLFLHLYSTLLSLLVVNFIVLIFFNGMIVSIQLTLPLKMIDFDIAGGIV